MRVIVSIWFLLFLGFYASGSSTNVYIVFEGDSLTEGSQADPQSLSNYVAAMNLPWNYGTVVTNIGHGGDYLYNNTNATDALTSLTNHSGYGKLVASLWMGVNDSANYSGDDSPASIQTAANVISTNTLFWINNVRASFPSCKIMLMTHTPNTLYWAKNAILTNVNNWIRASGVADVVNDLRADSRLSDATDTNYFADGLHLNNAGYDVAAGIVKSNLLYYNLLDDRTITQETFYVSTTGSGTNGSVVSPMALADAITEGTSPAGPDDTILLRAGTYTGSFTNTLNGAPGHPITLKAYPNERVIIDGLNSGTNFDVFSLDGSWVNIQGLEVMNSFTNRGVERAIGIHLKGQNCKVINCTSHDNSSGVFFQSSATNSEVYGCVFYNNGYELGDGGHGHGVYSQSNEQNHRIRDNIAFNQFGLGFQSYASGGQLWGFKLEGNTAFNNGVIASNGLHRPNFYVAGETTARNVYLIDNYGFYSGDETDGFIQFGENTLVCTNGDITLSNNVFSGGVLLMQYWTNYTVVSNTFALGGGNVKLAAQPSAGTRLWNDNTYYLSASHPFETGTNLDLSDWAAYTFSEWKTFTGHDTASSLAATKPIAPLIFLRTNAYQTGRANITIFNWGLSNNVSVDASGIMLTGARYVVRNAQDFFGTVVLSGTYSGGTLELPMTNLTVVKPIGLASAPAATGPDFNVFVIEPDVAPTTHLRRLY